jgi:photosynthetic reaction center H subunit
MNPNGMAQYFDVTTFLVFVFFVFFFGLVYYLLQENKREGYPMISDVTGLPEDGWPLAPSPKTYLLQDGTTSTLPNNHERDPYRVARRAAAFPGAPLEPTGVNPLADGIGPASYVEMREEPFKAFDGTNTLAPMRAAPGWRILGQDPDPRGWPVTAADGAVVGEVTDIWVDRGVRCIRYLEVALADGAGRVLAPLAFLTVSEGKRLVSTRAITAAQFSAVPRHVMPDQVTAREEDRISAYFAGGTLYGEPGRAEPLL